MSYGDRVRRSATLLVNNGYSCGSIVTGGGGKFFSREGIWCGDSIELQYFNPPNGTKGGRIVTNDVCALYYIDDYLLTPNEMKLHQSECKGKTPLMM